MNKKVISSVLAGAMALSTMGVVASASSGNTTEGNAALSAKAGLLEATINADLPQDVETFINPYRAKVAVTNGEANVATVMYSDGLISPTYTIKNYDSNALKVSATAKITPSSTVTVNTKALDEVKLQKATEKQVFAFLNTTTDAVSNSPVFSSTTYVGNAQQVAFTEDGAKAANIMTVAKTSGVGYFYVGGQCTPNPETAWDNKDTVTLDIILDLSPSAGDPANLTLSGVELVAGTAYRDFDAAKTSYDIAASGSKTKASAITVTATDTTAKVYVKYNGTLISATAAATKTAPGVTIAAGTATVKPLNDGATPTAAEVDYKAGDKVEFIVVNATTNESTTYTFNFTE